MTEEEKLKLGKGAAFVKSRISRPPESGETWEADFEAVPRPMTQTETHDLAMVVARKGGALLADLSVHGRPSVNDLATLLAHASRKLIWPNVLRSRRCDCGESADKVRILVPQLGLSREAKRVRGMSRRSSFASPETHPS